MRLNNAAADGQPKAGAVPVPVAVQPDQWFQHALPEAFAHADGVFIAQVARLDQLPEAERLKPEQVVADIAATGKPAFYEPTANDIVAKLKPLVKSGDVVVVFSNGGFDGIHDKLLGSL